MNDYDLFGEKKYEFRKIEVTNWPEKEKAKYHFKISNETKFAKRTLLTVSLLGISKGGLDIDFKSILGIILDGKTEYLQVILSVLSIYLTTSFFILFFRDIAALRLEEEKFESSNRDTLSAAKKDLISKKDFGLFISTLKSLNEVEILESFYDYINKNRGKDFKLNKKYRFSNQIEKDSAIKYYSKWLSLIKKADDKETHLMDVYNQNQKDIFEAKTTSSKARQNLEEVNLQLYQKWLIFILLDGIIPLTLGLISIILLFSAQDLSSSFIELINKFNSFTITVVVLFPFVMMILVHALISNKHDTKEPEYIEKDKS